MREYTINELFQLTQAELLRLDYKMATVLSQLEDPSEYRTIAVLNLHRIRRELGRRDFYFRL